MTYLQNFEYVRAAEGTKGCVALLRCKIKDCPSGLIKYNMSAGTTTTLRRHCISHGLVGGGV